MMKRSTRRFIALVFGVGIVLAAILSTVPPEVTPSPTTVPATGSAVDTLEKIVIKGRAPKTNYAREQFGNGWSIINGCDTRNIILYRDISNPVVDEDCHVQSGTLQDPYTGEQILFTRENGSAVQIDHVVALSDAWQKGAQQLSREQRIQLANDPLELLAVDGPANMEKSDADAATWLPSNKAFRCSYVARQIAVKQKYSLWVTQAEKEAILAVLADCPGQTLPAK